MQKNNNENNPFKLDISKQKLRKRNRIDFVNK